MLGMTAGAITVYVKAEWFDPDNLDNISAKFSLGYSLAIPLTLLLLCLIPLDFQQNVMSLFALLITTIACFLPFYFCGVTITLLLTKFNLPIGKIYASDLIGASFGCLFVLWGLDLLDAPSLILVCSAVGILSAYSFSYKKGTPGFRRYLIILFIFFIIVSYFNSTVSLGIRPVVIKGSKIEQTNDYLLEDWNSFSRVVVYKGSEGYPQLWGPSPLTPRNERITQYLMNIDGSAGTILRKFSSLKDIEHLKYDVTNIAFYLRPNGTACIIGIGAGKDVQSAILFGHEKIVGIDLNPIFIDLLQNRFREFAGIANYKGVRLVSDEARSYLSKTDETFSIIQMSLIDTWASTGAGAFSLSENILYTIEAWKTFFEHLDSNGIFTVSRWYNPNNLGETGRVVSLAAAALFRSGIREPHKHIAMVSSGIVSTLLVSKAPFSDNDISNLKKKTSELMFVPVILPGITPNNIDLKDIVYSGSIEELYKKIENKPLNYEPTTDDNPYFFNMLKLSNIDLKPYLGPNIVNGGVIQGNIIATITLLTLMASLLLLTIVTILIPLALGQRFKSKDDRKSKRFWAGAIYFSLIGTGFICIEIALLQKLSIFLGHPIYALGIILFTILLSTGIGSLVSEKLPLTKSPWLLLFPVITAIAVITARFVITYVIANTITSAMVNKIIFSVVLIFPIGFLMGFFFPTGMKLVKSSVTHETPWFWALNGVFSVLFSAVAVFLSIYFSISLNFYIAAICYFVTLFLVIELNKLKLAEKLKK
jgi:spermidine synthase